MQNRANWWGVAAKMYVVVVAACCLFGAGCDDGDDFDHTPPEGMGSLVVDNDTFDDLRVFVNGAEIGRVTDGHEGFFDLEPGLYRIVLDDEDGDRSYRNDVDVLDGRLTILYVDEPLTSFDDSYRVVIAYD